MLFPPLTASYAPSPVRPSCSGVVRRCQRQAQATLPRRCGDRNRFYVIRAGKVRAVRFPDYPQRVRRSRGGRSGLVTVSRTKGHCGLGNYGVEDADGGKQDYLHIVEDSPDS